MRCFVVAIKIRGKINLISEIKQVCIVDKLINIFKRFDSLKEGHANGRSSDSFELLYSCTPVV